MYKGMCVYKGSTLAEKTAIVPAQIRKKIELIISNEQTLSINSASIILADICGVLLGLRRSEFLASAEKKPNQTTLLCFRNLAGLRWDIGDCTKTWDIAQWSSNIALDEIIRIRLCYTKQNRHRVAHDVIAGPGYKLMSFALWLKITIKLRVALGEHLTINSPLLVRTNRTKLVPMTVDFMRRMDKSYAPKLNWFKATIHSRRRGFATAMVRTGIHMASITIAMRHSQGVTLQYVAFSIAEKASITTRLAIGAYDDPTHIKQITSFNGKVF